jgi:hypothetical protein
MLKHNAYNTDLVVSKSGDDAKTKLCQVFSYVSPRQVLKKLVASCDIMATLEPSENFSHLAGKLVAIFGGDKGGKHYTHMIRIANRPNGNQARHSQPLFQFEDGAENQENLAKTAFDPEKSELPNFLEDLANDRLHAVVVTVKDSGGRVVNSRCETIKFEGLCGEEVTLRGIKAISEGSIAELPESPLGSPVSKLHDFPGDDSLDDKSDDESILTDASSPAVNVLQARLVIGKQSSTELDSLSEADSSESETELEPSIENEDEIRETKYVGIELSQSRLPDPILRCKFSEALSIHTDCSIEFRCLNVVGFPSQDEKQASMVNGQGGNGYLCPCLICIRLKSDFKLFPKWQSKLLVKGHLGHNKSDFDDSFFGDEKDAQAIP